MTGLGLSYTVVDAADAAGRAIGEAADATYRIRNWVEQERAQLVIDDTTRSIYRATIDAVSQETYWGVWPFTSHSISTTLGVRWRN